MKARQPVVFLLCGAAAAGLNWCSRFLFSAFFPFQVAVVLAFLVGLSSGFLLMRLFVFNGMGKAVAPQASKYVLVNLLALAQTFVISVAMARWLLPAIGVTNHAEALGHMAGVGVPVVTSYFGHKLLTFR